MTSICSPLLALSLLDSLEFQLENLTKWASLTLL